MPIRKLYVASGAENWEKVQKVILNLQLLGFNITHNWTHTFDYWANGRNREGYDFAQRRNVGELERRGVIEAEGLVVLLPGSVGTHTEFGIALGLRKPVLITHLDGNHDVMDHLCPFYYDSLVQHVENVKTMYSTIGGWLDRV